MSDTVTFQDVNKRFIITTKKEFLIRCPEPATHNIYNLNANYYMFKYLHNPIGPAVIRLKDNVKEYWIDGSNLEKDDPERAKKIEHLSEFNRKIEDTFAASEACGSIP